MSNGDAVTQQPTTQIAKREPAPIAMTGAGLQLTTLEDAYRFSQYVVKARICPEGDGPEAVLVKMQAGAELGFTPIRSLSAFVVVKGRLSMMGEAILAKIRSSKACGRVAVGVRGEGDNREGYAEFLRADTGETGETTFSAKQAKVASLWGKAGPWQSSPDDMLIWRAVSRLGKRYFSDVLHGFDVAEVVEDYEDIPRGPKAATPVNSLPAPAEPDPLLAEDASEPMNKPGELF